MSSSSRAPRDIVRPKALRPGDTVAVAPLSSQLETDDELELYRRAVEEIEGLGFRVRPSPLLGVEHTWWWAAGRPREVAADVNALLRDPEIRAVWALAGGRFTMSYLDRIDYDAIVADPKPIIGMSDITSINLAVHSRTGLVTFQADPAVFSVSAWHELPGDGRDRQAEAYRRVLTSTEPIGALPALSSWETWRSGRAEGRLIGGQLNRLLKIQATPFALAPERFDGALLFLEDLALTQVTLWHDLHVLRLAGVFDRIAGLLYGPVETVRFEEGFSQTVREVVLDVLGDRDIPVIGNVNLGHAGPNLPLPLGVRAGMDAGALTIELLEPAVS
jgi:muramoyltetrapeptide carboxypeptidase